MQENHILKLCFYSGEIVANDVVKFLYMLNNLDRIYSNTYRQEYRNSIRYEDITLMKKYKEKEAVKLIKKRFAVSQNPFFLDFYEIGGAGEFISISRTGRYTFLYMQISSKNYAVHQNELQEHCDELLRANKILLGYCSRISIQQEAKDISWRRIIYDRHNKLDYDLAEESSFLEKENILGIEQRYINKSDIIIWK